MSRILIIAIAGSVLFTSTIALAQDRTIVSPPKVSPAEAEIKAPSVDFNRDIRPLLSDNCFFCHGPDPETREAGLRLDLEEEALAVIDREDPDASLLLERILSDDPDVQMPPPESGKQLKPEQKKLIEAWLSGGAPWAAHWAYVAPRKHQVPDMQSAWPKNWIDQFVLRKLRTQNMSPSGDADRTTLLRRICFDLTGLPPTPEQVEAFLADDSPGAFDRVVSQLLDSKHFGERMAVYWLDLVRFADTVGYHGDQDHNITPYRDWVIHAFNTNMPFDRFTKEQLAGDLLPEPSTNQLIATGYNRLLQTTHEGGLQPAEYRAMYAADRVRNVSAVWMGGTLGCAQCHDHKYDPYTTHDFYSMAAFFADIDDERHFRNGTNSLPTRRDPEIEVLGPILEQKVASLKDELKRIQQSGVDAASKTQRQKLEDRIQQISSEIAEIEKSKRRTMITQALETPRETRVLPRGNFLDTTGDVVQPSFPQFLRPATQPESARPLNRLDLANWLTDGDSDAGLLTARVFVNRTWYLLFGGGLSPSLDDFGGQGQPPTHPELLDNLAIEFVESGWDVKKLIRLMVNSRTYQLSSVATDEDLKGDPNNRFFGRQLRQRLPAEFLRDNALAVSGLLVRDIGGESSKPYQPSGYYRNLNFPTRKYAHHPDERQYRRGVYVHWQRQFLHPMFRAFDAPRREECAAERPRSNTPIAALVLMNDPTFVEAARVFAEELVARKMAAGPMLEKAFWKAVSRKPDSVEREALLDLYRTNLERFQEEPAAASKLLTVGLRKPNADLPAAQVAAMTEVIRAIFNLDEFISRP